MSRARRPDRSREHALLAAAARAALDGEPSADLRRLAAAPLDWAWVLRRAEEERLAALLFTVARGLPGPIPVLARLRTAWIHATRQHLLGVEQLRAILPAFERAGVPVIPLKGPAMAEALYRDPGMRPFTDLDLLVHRADLPAALQLLGLAGYRHLDGGRSLEFELAHKTSACFVPTGPRQAGVPVDLHWELLDYPGPARPGAIDLREAWERAVVTELWGMRVPVLAPEDLLVYLAAHLVVHHGLSGPLWRLDLALALRHHGAALDWAQVAGRARRWRVAGALGAALREIRDRFGLDLPAPALLARLPPPRLRRALLAWLRGGPDERLGRLDHLVPLLVTDRGADAARALARVALPPSRWVRARYDARTLPGAYLAHYATMARATARTAAASLGDPS